MNMKRRIDKHRCFLVILGVAAYIGIAGCSRAEQPPPPPSPSAPAQLDPVPEQPQLPPIPTGKKAAMSAQPNPIRVCDGSGVGTSAISFSVDPSVTDVQVRVGSPVGALFLAPGGSGFGITGKWVSDGITFYLQDTSDGKPLTEDNTLASVTVKVTSEGCPRN